MGIWDATSGGVLGGVPAQITKVRTPVAGRFVVAAYAAAAWPASAFMFQPVPQV